MIVAHVSVLGKVFLISLFQGGPKVGKVIHTVFSASSLSESMNGVGSFTRSVAYNEEAFRYLVDRESKRSERSGLLYQVLLIYRSDAQGVIVRMNSEVAKTVIATLSRCLRTTDYIGWYRADHVVGGVLTVVGRDSVADVFNRLRPRLWEILGDELGVEESGRLQIRVFQHHELERDELGAQSRLVN